MAFTIGKANAIVICEECGKHVPRVGPNHRFCKECATSRAKYRRHRRPGQDRKSYLKKKQQRHEIVELELNPPPSGKKRFKIREVIQNPYLLGKVLKNGYEVPLEEDGTL